jgi:hypothetical protein
MNQKQSIRWVIVSMYKTKPESEGWYISEEYKRNFWSILNKKFDKSYSSESTKNTFKENSKYGFIVVMPNIIFFDLVKYSKNNFKTTKDKELFEYPDFKISLKKGLSELDELIQLNGCETRVGLLGRNTSGIFLKCQNDSNQIDNSTLNQIKLKKTEYGLLGNESLVKNKNTSFYFLENITSRYYKIHCENMKGWDAFWSN